MKLFISNLIPFNNNHNERGMLLPLWANVTLDNMYEEIKTLEMYLNRTKIVRSSCSYFKHVRLYKLNHVFFQGVYGFSRPQLNRLYIHGLSLVKETIFIANMALVEGSCSMKLFSSTICLQQVFAPFGATGQLV